MIGSGYFDTGVLGDMDKPEALAFLQHLLPATQHDKLEAAWLEDAWPRIWEVSTATRHLEGVRPGQALYVPGIWHVTAVVSSPNPGDNTPCSNVCNVLHACQVFPNVAALRRCTPS